MACWPVFLDCDEPHLLTELVFVEEAAVVGGVSVLRVRDDGEQGPFDSAV